MTNTVKIGDEYEKKCFHIINNALQKEELCFPPDYSVVFEKSKYYSKDRDKNIIFDLSIEVTPKNSKKYQLLGIIECKSYSSKPVPVGDIEAFYGKVKQISGGNRKAIVITHSGFQASAIKYAENNNIMLINTNEDDYSIILHRTKRFQLEEINLEQDILKFLLRAFYEPKVIGLKKLSGLKIEEFTKKILLDYSNKHTRVTVKDMISFLHNKYNLCFVFDTDLRTQYGEETEGIYNIQNKTIFIDCSISNTKKMTFILGHEIGHFFLHSNLKINNKLYNSFNDSTYNILEKKHDLITDKDWIEWQANKFSSSLFLQKDIFMERLIFYRKKIGISSPEKIYLDNQPCNISDYYQTIDYLSNYFETTKLAIEFKLKELKLLTDVRKTPTLFDNLFSKNNTFLK